MKAFNTTIIVVLTIDDHDFRFPRHCKKKRTFPLRFCYPQFPADLVTFIEGILMENF